MAQLRLTFRDGTPEKIVTLGAFSQIAAKRRFGLEAIKTDDPEIALFGCFVELVGPAAAADVAAFDEWLQQVDQFSLVQEADDSADPSPAEIQSSEQSPGSPPNSD